MTGRFSTALVAAAALLCLGAATAAEAQQTWSGDGNTLLAPVGTEEYQLPDGRTVRSLSFLGFTITEDKASPFHLTSQDCKGTYVFEADGMSFTAAGYCVVRDGEGNMWWLWWNGGSAGGEWGVTNGAGKYTGMTGGGTWTARDPMPDGKVTNSWHGEVSW
jgi:hypothetical protein